MNAYFKILVVLLVAAAAYFFGHSVGVDQQKIADQKIFDKYNADATAQKAEASAKFVAVVMQKLALIRANEALVSAGEKRYEIDTQAARARAVQYSGRGLRFATAKDPGLGDRCDGASGTPAKADPAGATCVELPGPVAESLRQLTLDGDLLIAAYTKAYDWIAGMRCPSGAD